MLEAVSFSDAVYRLSTPIVIAPSYIIIGGTQRTEGVVLTRNRWKTLDAWFIDPSNGRLVILEY